MAEGVNDAACSFNLLHLQIVLVDEERYFSLHAFTATRCGRLGYNCCLVGSSDVFLELLVLAGKMLAESFVETTVTHFDQLAEVLEISLLVSTRCE